jgi:hypothetical protein
MAIKLQSRFSKYVRFELVGIDLIQLRPYGGGPFAPRTGGPGLAWTFNVSDLPNGGNERQIVRETGMKYGQGAITQVVDGLLGKQLQNSDEVDALDIESLVGVTGIAGVAVDKDEYGVETEMLTGLVPDQKKPGSKPIDPKPKS